MDLYCQMGDELRLLFNDLFDPRLEGAVRKQMARILGIAKQIGGSIKEEAERLNADVLQFLQRPGNPKLLAKMKQHALRLEQQMREL